MEHDLDSYASLYVDAIGYRESAAKANMSLAKSELEACGLMRKELLMYIYKALALDPQTHNISIKGKRVLVAENKPADKMPPVISER